MVTRKSGRAGLKNVSTGIDKKPKKSPTALDHSRDKRILRVRMKRVFLIVGLSGTFLMSGAVSLSANPYCGGWGGGSYRGGYGWGGCSRGGWYGTGIPNGLGWSLFGLGAAAVAAPIAYAVAAPAPVYYAPAPSVGYYNPPQTVIVERKSVVRQIQSSQAHTNDTLAKIQSKLASLGYYRGNIDGCFGPETAQAVSNFQAENSLSVTGRIDLKTLSSLGITL